MKQIQGHKEKLVSSAHPKEDILEGTRGKEKEKEKLILKSGIAPGREAKEATNQGEWIENQD